MQSRSARVNPVAGPPARRAATTADASCSSQAGRPQVGVNVATHGDSDRQRRPPNQAKPRDGAAGPLGAAQPMTRSRWAPPPPPPGCRTRAPRRASLLDHATDRREHVPQLGVAEGVTPVSRGRSQADHPDAGSMKPGRVGRSPGRPRRQPPVRSMTCHLAPWPAGRRRMVSSADQRTGCRGPRTPVDPAREQAPRTQRFWFSKAEAMLLPTG